LVPFFIFMEIDYCSLSIRNFLSGLYPCGAFCAEHHVAYQNGCRRAAGVAVVYAACRALNKIGRVIEKFLTGFKFRKSLFQCAPCPFYFCFAMRVVRNGNYSRIAMAFKIVLTVACSAFQLYHIPFSPL